MTQTATNEGRGRGFRSLDSERRKEIAALGGRAAHQAGRAHTWTSEEAQVAGRKGGALSRRKPKKEVV